MTDFNSLRDHAHTRRIRRELLFTTSMILAAVVLAGLCFLVVPAEAGPPKKTWKGSHGQPVSISVAARAQANSSSSGGGSGGDVNVSNSFDDKRDAPMAYAPDGGSGVSTPWGGLSLTALYRAQLERCALRGDEECPAADALLRDDAPLWRWFFGPLAHHIIRPTFRFIKAPLEP